MLTNNPQLPSKLRSLTVSAFGRKLLVDDADLHVAVAVVVVVVIEEVLLLLLKTLLLSLLMEMGGRGSMEDRSPVSASLSTMNAGFRNPLGKKKILNHFPQIMSNISPMDGPMDAGA